MLLILSGRSSRSLGATGSPRPAAAALLSQPTGYLDGFTSLTLLGLVGCGFHQQFTVLRPMSLTSNSHPLWKNAFLLKVPGHSSTSNLRLYLMEVKVEGCNLDRSLRL